MVKEVPVYLFLGFLDAGKTKFIQETLEDERFESSEKTLVLVLEEGETEFDPSRFRIKDFHIEALSMQEASVERLTQISHEYGAVVRSQIQAMKEGNTVYKTYGNIRNSGNEVLRQAQGRG